MFVSAFILLCSVGTVFYWLRAATLTLLDGQQAVTEAIRIAEVNRLEFPQVRQALQASTGTGDDPKLLEALRHDFLALTYLLRFAATVNVGRYSRQERLLVVDFHLMRLLYLVGRWVSPGLARYALAEMTSVVEHFAGVMSRRMSSGALGILGA